MSGFSMYNLIVLKLAITLEKMGRFAMHWLILVKAV